MFLNGKNYNYLAYGFSRIIPENRSAQFAYINLAGRNLSQYRVEYGNIQSGYANFPIARLDYPVNGIFRSPLTYYYGGNIVPTKHVPVYINNGYCAIRGTVYNEISISGNIVHFATNTDFQGHQILQHPEEFRSNSPYFNGTVMDNCSNFILHSASRLSKSSQPTLYNCKSFSGWFNFSGDGTRRPGFRGFLNTCRGGVFNFNLMNMRGGGSDGSVTNYYNFSCISNCNNIRLNINGSPWQAWVHPNCHSSNCNITTRYIVPGFDYMNHCNFNIYLPSNANVERSADYSILSNSRNCNIKFDNINIVNFGYGCFNQLNNCNITGNVTSGSSAQGFLERCDNLNVNLNFAESSRVLSMLRCNNIKGNIVAGNMTYVNYSSYINLNVSRGSLNLINVEHSIFNSNGTNTYATNLNNCKLEIYNCNDFAVNGAYNSNFNMHNAAGKAVLRNLNYVKFVERGGANYTITNIDNCYNTWIYANTVNGTIENAYNTRIELENNNANFTTLRVNKCEIASFPTSAAYTTNCTFNVSLPVALFRNSRYVTWANVWPHATPRGSDGLNTLYRTKAGLESVDNFSRCYLNCNDASQVNDSLVYFNSSKNMTTSLLTYFSRTVTADLANYATNIKLNVDCHNLNLGVFMAGPPHGFEYSSISADNIYCTTGTNYYVDMNYGTRIYCENFCNVAFKPLSRRFSDNYQPVLLINNYQHSNTQACIFNGGITRIGRLNYRGGMSVPLELHNGACMFINDTHLGDTIVDNALLFLGTKVYLAGDITVTNGGLVVNKANYSMDAIGKFVNRNNFTWNFTDSGPWGSQSLLDFCTNV